MYIYILGFYIRGFYSWEGFGRIYGTILVRHFGKPVFGFQKSNSKGNPHWRRMVFFGKRPAGFILAVQWNPFDFGKVCQKDQHLLERSFGVLLQLPHKYRSSFGGRVVPTKSSRAPIAPGFNPPVGDVEPSKFFDEDAEAGRKLLKSNVKTMKQPTWPSTTSRTLCRRWSNSLRLTGRCKCDTTSPIQLAFSMIQWRRR